MSFFSKFTKDIGKEIDGLKAKFSDDPPKDKDKPPGEHGTRGESDSYYGGAPPQQHQSHEGAYSSPPPAQHSYGGPPPAHSPYHPPSQSPYGAPPDQPSYGAPPGQQPYGSHDQSHYAPPGQAPYPPPSQPSGPPCPPGWTAKWDQNAQRWYYVEHSTGRSQWEAPSHGAVGGYGEAGAGHAPQYGSHDATRGYGGHEGQHGYAGQHGYDSHGGEHKEKKSSNALLYGAGGAAAGAIGGAYLMHQLGGK